MPEPKAFAKCLSPLHGEQDHKTVKHKMKETNIKLIEQAASISHVYICIGETRLPK